MKSTRTVIGQDSDSEEARSGSATQKVNPIRERRVISPEAFILQRRKPRPLGVVRDKRLCLTKVLGLKHWAAVWARMAQVQIEAECAVIAAKPKHA
jgi:hypothetical protein